jgi:UDP-2,3-diacylglucosamine hydrolase
LPVVLMHGDALCTDDHAYIAFRRQVRDPKWQAAFLARPLAERKAITAGMREGSREAQRDKSMAIMDVNEGEVAALFAASGAKVLIHGHTHRPASHETAAGERHVLTDWDCDHLDDAGNTLSRGGWLSMTSDGRLRRHTLG